MSYLQQTKIDPYAGEGAVIHSLASNDISGNILQLDTGGGGPARRMTFVQQVMDFTFWFFWSTQVAEVFAGMLEGKIPGFLFKNR